MDPNSNSQKPYSCDLTIPTSFHLDVREDEEILSMVHPKIKKCKIEFQLAKTFNMNSFKSQAQCLKHLLEYIEKLCKETKENCWKSVLKNHRRVRNLKKAKEDKKYPLFIVIQVKKSNGGKSQLLNRLLLISKDEERRLVWKVHSIAFAEIEIHRKALEIDPDCEPGQDEDEKIELSKKIFNRFLELLENRSEPREECLENFADYSFLRNYVIQKLTEIEQASQQEVTEHAIGGAGAGAQEIVSGIAPVAAIPAFLSGVVSFDPSFILPAAPAVIPSLVVNGGIAAEIDGFPSFGSKLAKLTLLRQRMKAPKKVLQGRKRDFADMKNWLKPTKELIEDAFPGSYDP